MALMPMLTLPCLRCGAEFAVIATNGQGAPPTCAACAHITEPHPRWSASWADDFVGELVRRRDARDERERLARRSGGGIGR